MNRKDTREVVSVALNYLLANVDEQVCWSLGITPEDEWPTEDDYDKAEKMIRHTMTVRKLTY